MPLGEDGLLFRKEQSFPAFADGVEENLGVKSGAVLGGWGWARRIARASRFPFNRRGSERVVGKPDYDSVCSLPRFGTELG
jgi:hypothetical protein